MCTKRLHLGSGDTKKLDLRLGRFQRANQQTAEQIAGGFARDYANLDRNVRHVGLNE
jgi:hypothetical protein